MVHHFPNPARWPHPICGLPGFQVAQIRFCSMHIVNLGILQNLMGSLISLLFQPGILTKMIICFFFCLVLFRVKLDGTIPKQILASADQIFLGVMKDFEFGSS